ncbi:hypothetical protein INS49_005754 [Diaporthe citri]|uniref:uncharacterized protein n=1 Tax=Diaporthe citri TaxID=83186 RepID=UPI001C812E98|nr:uncharacterized protein INS49_005754 [Diaporthe citri]KAG6364156.1 hypothetical protein INS49_005754 [Diaporthe citri]
MPAETKRGPFHENPPRDVDPEIARQLNSELQDGTRPTTEALAPLGLRYLKILGAGSQGTAVLFEMDAYDGTKRKLVAEYETAQEDDDDSIAWEKEWMRATVGARHIIQRQLIHGFDIVEDEDEYEDDSKMYLMEFMLSFELVSLCPTQIGGHSVSVPFSKELVPTRANGRVLPPQDNALINLDINYNNVMIGDYDVDPGVHPHDEVPIFKYGGYVLNEAFDHYDKGLRMTIAWIMAHSPGKRPEMLELQEILMKAVRRDYDEGDRISIAELLESPPPPPP